MTRPNPEPQETWGERFFDMLPDLLLVCGLDGQILKVNPAWSRTLGWDAAQLRGPFFALVHPEDRARLDSMLRELAARGEVLGRELRLATQDGRWRTVLWSARAAPQERVVYAVGSDITSRKQSELLLEEKSRQLTMSNAELDRFASIVSHDLQAPVRKIMLFGDRLRSQYGDLLPPQAQDYLRRMHGSSERVHTLINDLLHYSRAASMPFEPTAVDLNQVGRQVLSDLEEMITDRGAQVTLGPMPTVESSRSQMQQLFQNLISNAMKFHKPNEAPRLSINAEWDEQVARISFQDQGIGIDERHSARIFGIFQRLHKGDEYPGSGVGLAICARIAERHGGIITVRSQPGEGARFTVVIPMRQPLQSASR